MTRLRHPEPTATYGRLLPPDARAIPVEVIEETERQDRARTEPITTEPVRSSEFAATLIKAGVRQQFRALQKILAKISAAEPDIQAYGSGDIFRDMAREFEATSDVSILDNAELFGNTNTPTSRTVIADTRKALRRVGAAMNLIQEALILINSIYDRIDGIVSGSNSDFLSLDKRTENLLVWAYRSGARLNKDISGKSKLGIETKQTRAVTDMFGLLNLLDGIVLELQTLSNIPAYYRSATNSDTSKIETPVKTVNVLKGESLEQLAFRELGSADKVPLIMEFNNLTPDDILGSGWDGRALNLPYFNDSDVEQLRNNFVLDAQTGIKALGKDLPNEIEAFQGDLVLLDYTDNFFQSLDNLIQTPQGAIAESPEYGNRALKIDNVSIPQISGQMTSTEIQRALTSNPRVLSVSNVEIKKEGASVEVKYQVAAVNRITEDQQISHLDQT